MKVIRTPNLHCHCLHRDLGEQEKTVRIVPNSTPKFSMDIEQIFRIFKRTRYCSQRKMRNSKFTGSAKFL